ncbi:type II toxin-antitoxin system HipA family toxin [Arsukibacterium ikkense]|uniref:type II toxin-antitoxin system HipA family toxin n=1 Tax=Arsukibacterium ikkense TaxID=336831 RepID=UPI00069BAB45|nr:type II toxin-antitoxin system HipA family toxin [Arsukibacterium ikkense]
MKELRVGYVYSHKSKAGTLRELDTPTGAIYEFQYTEHYLRYVNTPIGVNLPVQSAPFVFNTLHPFFANLLSEGWVKRHQAKMARLDQEDTFGLLLANGRELIGPIAIHVNDDGDVIGGFELIELPLKSLRGFSIDFARAAFNDVAVKSLPGTSISGVQPKMFLKLAGRPKTLTNAQGIGNYIVKPSPESFPELAENEFMVMQLCQAVGMRVADHYLVPFSCGELAYVTTRFDMEEDGHINNFVEDMASCMNVAPGQKDNEKLSYEKAIKTAHRLSGGHAKILIDGFTLVLMAYVVGNNDLHLKNMTLLRERGKSNVKGFSPVYDMLSVAPYPTYEGYQLVLWLLESEVDNEFTSSYNAYGYYTSHDFIELGIRIGLGESMARSIIQKVTAKVGRAAAKVIMQNPGSEKLKQCVLNRIKERLAALTRPAL